MSNYKQKAHVRASKQHTALIADGLEISYGDLCIQAERIAESVPARSIVAFVATNTAEAVIAYVGFLKKGVVPLMVSSSIGEKAFLALLEKYSPEYVWCPKVFTFDRQGSWEYGSYRLVPTGLKTEITPHPDLALLLTTSGSTGSQKYVRLSYGNLEANARSIAEYLSITEKDRAITTLPFSYSYGISIVNSHLISGASLILTDKSLFDREFWRLLKEYEATTFGGVPYTYSILKRLHFDRMDLPSLRYITQAGGHLGEDLQKEFATLCAKRDIGFFVMYGQTEGTARLAYLPVEYATSKLGSIGVAIPGGRLTVLNDSDQEVREPGVIGELVYRGDNVSYGYAERRADLALGNELGGMLRTGDIACFDEDGFARIVGRKKRFLKVFGNRVNLDEVERLLSEQGFVVACAGRDDALRMYVEQGEPTEVCKFVAEKTGLNKGAFTAQSIESLPRNEAGKILYSELEKL